MLFPWKTRRSIAYASVFASIGLAPFSLLPAQSAQPYALQLAAMSTSIGVERGDNIAGYGVEPQFRFNSVIDTKKFVVSLGLGAQYTSHTAGAENLKIKGVFIEPRLVPALRFERFFPYISGRLALLQQSSNFGTSSGGSGYGAGVGIAIPINRYVNIDGGVSLVRQQFNEFTYNLRDGAGNQVTGSFEPFTTYSAKVGLSWGFPQSHGGS